MSKVVIVNFSDWYSSVFVYRLAALSTTKETKSW